MTSTNIPLQGILPKAETEAALFLNKYPLYDGRGTVVAIFDTGVDPGAPGLQQTSDGRPKIIDIVDATSGGDVRTDKVVKAENGKIAGLSGRTLTIPESWKNPSGDFYIGCHRAYSLFATGVVAKLKQQRRRKFDISQAKALAEAQRALSEFKAVHVKIESEECMREKEEIEARLKVLKDMAAAYDDPGPILDCIVFHDGENWRAAVDTTETGNFTDIPAMTDFHIGRQYASFDDESLVNFCVNIYDNGKTLSVVADSGAHGTHVAGIVAANMPNQPELNGIAPGAQIVSIKIGDNRVDAMETGPGLERAVIAAIRSKVDLINMSFGEPSSSAMGGRFLALAKELVSENNITFLAAAGNEGPALSTVSAPGTGEYVMGIGAYVSAPMMKQSYSMREELSETHYTWTSRGPAVSGALGPSVSAPGGAIAPVPNWTHRRNQLMNGTSMASPNACGGAALIVSALKQRKVPYTSHLLRRAIENSARRVEGAEVFANGYGLIQVERAFESLLAMVPLGLPGSIHYQVRCGPKRDACGVYIREPHAIAKKVVKVFVTPEFPRHVTSAAKVDFQVSVALTSSATWIQTPSNVVLMGGGRNFEIEVNPLALGPGVHFAEVIGCADDDSSSSDPLFRIPVTVIVPTLPPVESSALPGRLPTEYTRDIQFHPGKIVREFLHIPSTATWADIRLTTIECETSINLAIHAVQLCPQERFDKHQLQKVLALKTGTEKTFSMKVVGGGTLELCLAQWWSSLRSATIRLDVSLHGVVPSPQTVTLSAGEPAKVSVKSALRPEVIEPVVTLKKSARQFRPTKYDITSLSYDRDMLPPEKPMYAMVLTYEWEQEAAGSVTPKFPLINGRLYEAQVGSQMYTIFDSRNRVVHQADVYPETPKLPKGKLTLSLIIRHEDYTVLESFKDLLLVLESALEKDIKCSVYADYDGALLSGKAMTATRLAIDEATPVFIQSPAASAIPSSCKPGDVLIGTVTYGKKDDTNGGCGQRPGGYPVSVIVPPAPAKKKEDEGVAPSTPPKPSFIEAQREWQIKYLETADDKAYQELSVSLITQQPSDIKVLAAIMRHHNRKEVRLDRIMEVSQAAEAVISHIDTNALACHLGRKKVTTTGLPPSAEEAARVKKLDDQVSLLKEALVVKLLAFADSLIHFSSPPKSIDGDIESFAAKLSWTQEAEDTYKNLCAWVDIKDKEYAPVRLARALGLYQMANSVQIARDAIKDLGPDHERVPLIEQWLAVALANLPGWSHWLQHQRNWNLVRAPPSKVLL